MDSALRKHFLHSLDRDLSFAREGLLGEVIMPVRWSNVRKWWRSEFFLKPVGGVIDIHLDGPFGGPFGPGPGNYPGGVSPSVGRAAQIHARQRGY